MYIHSSTKLTGKNLILIQSLRAIKLVLVHRSCIHKTLMLTRQTLKIHFIQPYMKISSDLVIAKIKKQQNFENLIN